MYHRYPGMDAVMSSPKANSKCGERAASSLTRGLVRPVTSAASREKNSTWSYDKNLHPWDGPSGCQGLPRSSPHY